jgi:hypothetical protein
VVWRAGTGARAAGREGWADAELRRGAAAARLGRARAAGQNANVARTAKLRPVLARASADEGAAMAVPGEAVARALEPDLDMDAVAAAR